MKVFRNVIFGILVVLLVFYNGLNLVKKVIYNDYYSFKSDICENPGLNDGFICQGIAVSEKDNRILISGYMDSKVNSRIYVTDFNSNSYYVNLEKNGNVFMGHCGGIAINGNDVFIADDDTIYTVSLDDVLNSSNGDIVDVGNGVSVNNSASFVYTDDNYIYVGEFHDGGKYVCNHIYETNEGTHSAIISRYDLNDLSKPNKIYSIRNKVQGVCFMPDGRVVFSTSYGLADTVYYVYNEKDAVDSNLVLDGAPVYLLDRCIYEFTGPAMGEDLDYYNGKVITLTESASNKYIFGKFFFANKIVALAL